MKNKITKVLNWIETSEGGLIIGFILIVTFLIYAVISSVFFN